MKRSLNILQTVLAVVAAIVVLGAAGAVYWALRPTEGTTDRVAKSNDRSADAERAADETPVKGPKPRKKDYAHIWKTAPKPRYNPNLIARPDQRAAAKTGIPVIEAASEKSSSTGKFRFIGTIGDETLRCAVFQDAVGNQKPLYAGDTLDDMRVVAVHPRKAVVEVRGRRETLALPEPSAGRRMAMKAVAAAKATAAAAEDDLSKEVVDEPTVIRREWLKVYKRHLGRIYQQARMVNYSEGGKIVGLRILSFSQPNAVLQKRGIEAGDVIYTIAGAPANKLLDVNKALGKIIDEDEVEMVITIRRGDKKQDLYFDIEFD